MENFIVDKKEVIIVYDNDVKEYADYLFDLISTKENIDAARWSIKEYEQSKATISSKNYTIFLGNNDFIQNKKKFISEIIFNEDGMFYGWIGKSAILSIDYVQFSPKINEKLKKIILLERKNILSDIKWYNFIPFLNPFTSLKMTKKISGIKNLLYIELIDIFYKDGLGRFLGE